jgi:hypothetical protein
MSGINQVRGQPLVALLAVLGGWIGGRVATWEPPSLIEGAVASEQSRSFAASPQSDSRGYVLDPRIGPLSLPGSGGGNSPSGIAALRLNERADFSPVTLAGRSEGRGLARSFLSNLSGHRWAASVWSLAPGWAPPEMAASHIEPPRGPGLSGYAALPSLSAMAAQPAPPPSVGQGAGIPPQSAPEPARPRRWSGDAWALMRQGGGATVAGVLPATYGASQSGAVLRYRIDMRNAHRPAAYVRTTSTLGGLQETAVAAGLSARPLPALPVVAAVEGRMTEQGGRRRFQPALMAVTELPPFQLPWDVRGEAYGQAGYVGGSFATLFADGQFRFDKSLLTVGAVDARLGGGVWGGIQRGARRLDLGPSALVTMPLGKRTYGRIAVDWRFRTTGNAEPASGPAVTLSAGF